MGADTKIEWATHTFSGWRGCTKVSDGCKYCYAEQQSKRKLPSLPVWGPQGTRVMASESYWKQPLLWDKKAEAAGERHRVFSASIADVGERPETCPADYYHIIRQGRRRLFDLIAWTPNLDWLLLTKRPETWMECVGEVLWTVENIDTDEDTTEAEPATRLAFDWIQGKPPANVWMGTSVENQLVADTRIPALLQIPAALRFLSCEPLLSEVNLFQHLCDGCSDCDRPMPRHIGGCFNSEGDDDCDGRRVVRPKVDWVIAGGESGPHARPCSTWWAEYLQFQCSSASVPFFWKQWGEWFPRDQWEYNPDLVLPNDDEAWIPREGKTVLIKGNPYHKVGKDKAGRRLFGREYNEIPTLEETK